MRWVYEKNSFSDSGYVDSGKICLTGCKKLAVTWKNYDGTVLEVDENIKKGTIPECNGENPTRPSDNDTDYAFKGWSPTIWA
jgi:hypothetical protein